MLADSTCAPVVGRRRSSLLPAVESGGCLDSVSLHSRSNHFSSSLHFTGASTHRRQSQAHCMEKLYLLDGQSVSSSTDTSDSDEEDDSDDDDSSSYDSFHDESSLTLATDFNVSNEECFSKEDKQNGFVFTLEKIQSMRFGKSIATLDLTSIADTTESVLEFSAVEHPRDTYYKVLLEEIGTYSQRSYLVVPDHFFVEGDVKSHTHELLTAVRRGDLRTIQRLHRSGLNLQCRNHFNETIVHTAARRGMYEVLEYLVNVAGVSPRVCCDTGRTPLHDAAWTDTPNFDVVTLLLRDCPDFLGLKDARNCTPFDYVPKSAYEKWNKYLEGHRKLIVPKGYY